jgi:hypothetical protein
MLTCSIETRAYILFVNDEQDSFKHANPDVTHIRLMGMMSAHWAGMMLSEKAPYVRDARFE